MICRQIFLMIQNTRSLQACLSRQRMFQLCTGLLSFPCQKAPRQFPSGLEAYLHGEKLFQTAISALGFWQSRACLFQRLCLKVCPLQKLKFPDLAETSFSQKAPALLSGILALKS